MQIAFKFVTVYQFWTCSSLKIKGQAQHLMKLSSGKFWMFWWKLPKLNHHQHYKIGASLLCVKGTASVNSTLYLLR